MGSIYKFGSAADGPSRFDYPNVWAIESTTGADRLIVAPRSGQVDRIIEFLRVMTAPFWILYVLTVARGQSPEARYQSAEPLDREATEAFFIRYRSFFENDARHNIWLKSATTTDLLVYDKHNVIYAYGNLPAFQALLNAGSLQQVDKVTFPSPHTHNYNAEFDDHEQDLMRYVHWTQSPLHESDDL
jgi:hypothetical protein